MLVGPILSCSGSNGSFQVFGRFMARQETGCNDAGCSYELAEQLLVTISNHELLRTTFVPQRFYDSVSYSRKFAQRVHNQHPGPIFVYGPWLREFEKAIDMPNLLLIRTPFFSNAGESLLRSIGSNSFAYGGSRIDLFYTLLNPACVTILTEVV
jgi:hypothetical protein